MSEQSNYCSSLDTSIRVVACIALVWILATARVDAQSIISFAPESGPIGAAVTINGTGFSAIQAENTVLFGGAKATVTSATTSQLIVSVPAGATYEPISVLAKGRTAYSAAPFIVTNPNTAPLGPASFSSKVSLPITGEGISLSDLDGDGKLDIISVTHTYDGTAISIYKNESAPGSISNELAVRFSFSRLWYADVAVGDLNGDGKPDILAAGFNGMIILKNISSTGTLGADSFSQMDFAIGTCTSIALGDLDNDGRPDLALTSFNIAEKPIILILKNVVTGGEITQSSFAPPVTIPAIIGGHSGISIRDLDNDQRPDLIWRAKDSGGFVSVCRNNSTPGILNQESFGPVNHLAISGTSCHHVVVGDLTHDGFADLAAAFWWQVQVAPNDLRTYYNVEFFQGQPHNGELSFVSMAETSNYETTRGLIRLGDLNGDGNIDLVWGSGDILANVSTGDQMVFNRTGTLGPLDNNAPPDIAVGDIDGDGAPDIVGRGGVFRNLVSELSITSFSPEFGTTGSSVTIGGTHFSPTLSENIVKINGITADVTASTAGSVTIVIPPGASSGKLTITVNGKIATSPADFIINNIVSFTPDSGTLGTPVTIRGVAFDINNLGNVVQFGDGSAVVLSSTDSTITTTVPEGAYTGPLRVTANGVTSVSTASFRVLTHGGQIVTSASDPIEEFSIYPIPTKESLYVRGALSQTHDYKVINSVGKPLYLPVQHTAEESVIDVRDLAAGLYFLRISTSRGVIILKFAKE